MPTLDTTTVPKIKAITVNGPSSYATGGFTADFSADFSFVRSVRLSIETRGSLATDEYEVTAYNQDSSGVSSPGKCVIKLQIGKYRKTTVSSVDPQPAGITVQAAKTATGTATGSSHTHTIDHDHPSTETGTPTNAGNNTNAAAGGVAYAGHTHTVDIGNFTGSSGASTHTHDRSFEYDHTHSLTFSTENVTMSEVASGTNLSTTVWRALVIGD